MTELTDEDYALLLGLTRKSIRDRKRKLEEARRKPDPDLEVQKGYVARKIRVIRERRELERKLVTILHEHGRKDLTVLKEPPRA